MPPEELQTWKARVCRPMRGHLPASASASAISPTSPREYSLSASDATLDDQVQALLRGDMSPIMSMSPIICTTHTPSKISSRCPEYEHFRTITKRRQRRKISNSEDYDISNDDTSTTAAVAQDQCPSGHEEMTRTEYILFRNSMRQMKARRKVSGTGISTDTPDSPIFDTTIQTSEERNLPHISNTVEQPYDGHNRCLSFSVGMPAGWGDKKELGQVEGLLGTVLGRNPPSSSPFICLAYRCPTRVSSEWSSSFSAVEALSDTEDLQSIEIVFDN